MSCRLLVLIALPAALSLSAQAQSADPNPAHDSSVFLGNHRPKESKNKTPTSRSVTGKVVDGAGQPLQGALVTLTDPKNNENLTFITKKDGRYNFDDLSFTVDYQLQARYQDTVSPATKLSQYDHSPKLVRILEVSSNAATATSAESKKEAPEPKQ
ncbi:MAG: carboxypeptidase regulatory-like domain-containing protein [Acidobacteriaceae bacterium]|nr:carboxypeptidase regulatory-like domain-containing protein [Acidobacteriaceae bacterium]